MPDKLIEVIDAEVSYLVSLGVNEDVARESLTYVAQKALK
jgi:hypothetical protein